MEQDYIRLMGLLLKKVGGTITVTDKELAEMEYIVEVKRDVENGVRVLNLLEFVPEIRDDIRRELEASLSMLKAGEH